MLTGALFREGDNDLHLPWSFHSSIRAGPADGDIVTAVDTFRWRDDAGDYGPVHFNIVKIRCLGGWVAQHMASWLHNNSVILSNDSWLVIPLSHQTKAWT